MMKKFEESIIKTVRNYKTNSGNMIEPESANSYFCRHERGSAFKPLAVIYFRFILRGNLHPGFLLPLLFQPTGLL